MSEMKNTNLAVAKFAFESVSRFMEENKGNLDKTQNSEETSDNKNLKEYKTLVKKMNILIQKNGMIGTLVFLLSKSLKNKHHKEVLKNIRDWCERDIKLDFLKEKGLKDTSKMDNAKFIENITNLTSREYLFLTQEMMTLFGWIKRFADGMIEGD